MRNKVLLLALLLAPFVYGADYYVDNSCPINGDGSTDDCANGASGPFNDLQNAIDVLQAGDTLYIMQGTGVYATNNDCDGWAHSCGGFHVQKQGTAENPVRITTYPNHDPLITNCDELSNTYYCEVPTFTTGNGQHTIFDGLRIQGAIWMRGQAPWAEYVGNQVLNSEFTVGWTQPGDNNWAAIYLQAQRNVTIRNNYIHSVENLASQSGQAFIKVFWTDGVLIEYNTFSNPDLEAGVINEKNTAANVTTRFNLFNLTETPFQYQHTTNSHAYGNVYIAKPSLYNGCMFLGLRPDSSVFNHHNTYYGCWQGIIWQGETLPFSATIYDNIFAGITDMTLYWHSSYIGPQTGEFHDYNMFTPGNPFVVPAGSLTLQQYRDEYGFELNSQMYECEFVNASAGDFRLAESSPCLNASSTGGEVGAYAMTDCVGHLCGLELADGVCGSRNTTYPASTSDWPGGSQYCFTGQASASPAFPTTGQAVFWDCQGVNGGADVQCSAARLESIPGDLNSDGVVDLLDLLIVTNNFRRLVSEFPSAAVADVNNDGVVDLYDLVFIARNWGQTE
jgi:hypothetical protein